MISATLSFVLNVDGEASCRFRDPASKWPGCPARWVAQTTHFELSEWQRHERLAVIAGELPLVEIV